VGHAMIFWNTIFMAEEYTMQQLKNIIVKKEKKNLMTRFESWKTTYILLV
jgi:hypothetical protein